MIKQIDCSTEAEATSTIRGAVLLTISPCWLIMPSSDESNATDYLQATDEEPDKGVEEPETPTEDRRKGKRKHQWGKWDQHSEDSILIHSKIVKGDADPNDLQSLIDCSEEIKGWLSSDPPKYTRDNLRRHFNKAVNRINTYLKTGGGK